MDCYSNWTTSVTIRDNYNRKMDYRTSEYNKAWYELHKRSKQQILRNWFVKQCRKREMQCRLRTYYRTSLFRDELIYMPNVGYKYFEALTDFIGNNIHKNIKT